MLAVNASQGLLRDEGGRDVQAMIQPARSV